MLADYSVNLLKNLYSYFLEESNHICTIPRRYAEELIYVEELAEDEEVELEDMWDEIKRNIEENYYVVKIPGKRVDYFRWLTYGEYTDDGELILHANPSLKPYLSDVLEYLNSL